MTLVERVGEGLARRTNRRTTLKRAAAAVFGAVAAWSVEGFRGNGALAQQCEYVTEGDCSCNPPYGVYCNHLDPSFCAGSGCSGGCYYDESYRYAGACWCSATCDYGGGEMGYYVCCDCNCYGQQCACREFIATAAPEPAPEPEPGPDRPRGGGRGEERPPGFPPSFPFCD